MNSTADPTGTIDKALAHTRRLLDSNPVLAAEQASEILKVAPNQPLAMLLLAVARRTTGDIAEALAILERLTAAQPSWAAAHYEFGAALGDAGAAQAAVVVLRRAVSLKPDLPDAWRDLGDQLTALGDGEGADAAYARHIKTSNKDPRLMAAAFALCENEIPKAEFLLREHLKKYPTDVAAIRMFAEVAGRLRRYRDAEYLLARCLELAPGFNAARYNYAMALYRQNRAVAALQQIETQLAELEVKAPADAIVEVLQLRPGDLISPGAPVATLVEVDRLWVRVYVPEPELGYARAALGKDVPVTVDSFPGAVFNGRIEEIASRGEFTPRNVQTRDERAHQVFGIRIRLDNSARKLSAGMAADVTIPK